MLLGALCTIARAQVAAYDLTSPFAFRGAAEESGTGIDLVSHGHDPHGSAWVTEPFAMPPGGSFTAEFDVQLQPEPGPGGGLVFVIQALGPDALGNDGGGLGYEGIAPSVAVELDVKGSYGTYDPDDNHVGIDRDGSVVSLATAPVPFPLEDWRDLHGRVDYLDGQLGVSLDPPDQDYRAGPLLVAEVELPAGPLWVGFTAASGDHPASRRVDGFTFVVTGSDPTGPTGVPGDTGAELADSALPRVFFCGCDSVDPSATSLAGLAVLGLVLRRRTRR